MIRTICILTRAPQIAVHPYSSMTRTKPMKRAYVETYGCQMNISDGELMEGILEAAGYAIVSIAPRTPTSSS